MSDYTDQPPPSSGTLQPPSGGVNHPSGLPATGSDLAPLAGVALLVAVTGAALVTLARRARRDPWPDAERDRKREWDRLARSAKAKGATQWRVGDGKTSYSEWRDLP